jgi:hypothetical protein
MEDLAVWLQILYGVLCVWMVMVAGLMAGLTLSFFAQDPSRLEAMLKVDSMPRKKRGRIKTLLNLLAHKHRLLISLIVINMVMDETLPVLLDQLVPTGMSIILSVTAIVIFGEILPQAVCAKYTFQIAGFFALPMQLITWILLPITWPLSLILDWALGRSHEIQSFTTEELKQLILSSGMNTDDPFHYSLSFFESPIERFIETTVSSFQGVYVSARADESISAVLKRIHGSREEMLEEEEICSNIVVIDTEDSTNIMGYTSEDHIMKLYQPFSQ